VRRPRREQQRVVEREREVDEVFESDVDLHVGDRGAAGIDDHPGTLGAAREDDRRAPVCVGHGGDAEVADRHPLAAGRTEQTRGEAVARYGDRALRVGRVVRPVRRLRRGRVTKLGKEGREVGLVGEHEFDVGHGRAARVADRDAQERVSRRCERLALQRCVARLAAGLRDRGRLLRVERRFLGVRGRLGRDDRRLEVL
jgi:hypothetical protein